MRALRRAFLLLDEILQAVDLLLQVAVGFLQLGAIAEQRQDPMVLLAGRLRAQAELEKTKLSQRLHEGCGGCTAPLMRRVRSSCGMRSDDLAPRSIPATCLTSRCGPSADPVHAPHSRAAP